MPRGFIFKMRARLASAKRRKTKGELKRLGKIENRLEKDIDEMGEELEALQNIEDSQARKHREFSWITGRITTLVLQDFVGAAFGAIFFVVTQEVWELSLRLGSLNLAGIFTMSFILTFLLIYLSRRRKTLSARLYHTSFLRGIEVYTVSLATAFIFVGIFGTASGFAILNQTILVALPATLSAATADL